MDLSKPNAFISIPITNEEVCKNISKVQEAMIEHSPILKDYVQKENSIHITLDVYAIGGDEIDKYKRALQELGEEIKKDILQNGPLCIRINNLKTFFQEDKPKIVYACIKPGEALNRLYNWKAYQRKIFRESHGLLSKTKYNWSPHITVAKKIVQDSHIPIESFEKFKKHQFGVQEIETIELRSMEEDETGMHELLEKYVFKKRILK